MKHENANGHSVMCQENKRICMKNVYSSLHNVLSIQTWIE